MLDQIRDIASDLADRIRPSAYPLRHAENNTRNVFAADDKKGTVFSIVAADSRWVGDLITLHAVNVNSSCFKCPLMREEKNGPAWVPDSKSLLYD